MERLEERLEIAANALDTLRDLLVMELPEKIKRDAAIIRLIYTFEAIWKAAQRFLLDVEGIAVGTPNGTIRSSRDANLLSDEQTEAALSITKDRNLAVHAYNEQLADQIFSRVSDHTNILGAWLDAMKDRIEETSGS